MLALVEHLAKSLVDQPDAVKVTQVDNGKEITIHLTVAQEDMGKVIGKQGRIAKAIRTVVKAAAVKADKRVTVEIM
ncbi:MAG: KH domain-containing protein [Peptococcaceae bacterium]|nr:KH domain-containing protein [Peptococcaceae bacterium]MBQ2021492.1 KH domain-containing protein [Peptococcaceae bacterium]MBQ2368557.1 KH domain-containing protein [Peptococcaceae bacterium]MBQ2431842.1 KH domain-containing protein [Peptococcaceae bacterium]MBQ5368595.1 KH domain-containing protein [Peptococcaceae bacterium]